MKNWITFLIGWKLTNVPLVSSKAPVSQLVNAEVNSGNSEAVLVSNYATWFRGRHAALRECITYKQSNN